MTLHDILTSMTVDELVRLLPLISIQKSNSKKADLIRQIEASLAGDLLLMHFQKLTPLEQTGIAEAMYDSELFFRRRKFQHKYGESLALYAASEGRVFQQALALTPIRLFLYETSVGSSLHVWYLPRDLAERLRPWVQRPAPAVMRTTAALPDEVRLTVRETEQEVLQDLPAVLRLVEQGKVQVGEKTGLPSALSAKAMVALLMNGDFYPASKESDGHQAIGPVKGVAWPLLLQAAKLASISGKKLVLSKAGFSALSKPAAETVRVLWQKWLKTNVLDEFSRINEIKGQRSKGKGMTAVAGRRTVIEEGLRACPVGAWVTVEHFFSYLQAAQLHFTVSHVPSKLYIGSPDYGYFGDSTSWTGWQMLEGRYILCLLFEYAATLGLLDVAYVDPERARTDFRGHWGADDLLFLSRYDGLRFIRLTSLGAYCLGLTTECLLSKGDSEQPEAPRAPKTRVTLASKTLKRIGTALLLECPDESTTARLSEHEPGAKFCQRVGKKQLMVKLENEAHFLRVLNELGLTL